MDRSLKFVMHASLGNWIEFRLEPAGTLSVTIDHPCDQATGVKLIEVLTQEQAQQLGAWIIDALA